MATYSRSQTTTQTSQSAAMPSMDISSLLVKTMENVMNDEENGNKDLEKAITDAINSSDLLKDKTRNDKDKELTDLLKDKKNSDKELSNFLKEVNKNFKDSEKERKESTVKSTSDKITNVLGKLVAGGAIGSAITGIMGAKGVGGALKGAASGAISGTGKVAGGLLSGVGNIGGTLIAGVGKLFGPVGAIIGKAVGAAVAAPFKIVGGTITTAIDGLGKLMSMPLKELVTKGTLIVAVLSQLFVFLEGLMAKFIAEKDIKWIDFMSKLKSNIAIIPDKIKLSLEQILSKVRIMGKPIYGSLSEAEEAELGELGIRAKFGDKNDPLYQYDQLLSNKKTGIVAKEAELQGIQDEMRDQFRKYTGGKDLDLSQYNLNTTAGKDALKAAWLSNVSEEDKSIVGENIDSLLADYSYTSGSLNDARKRAAYLEKTNPEIARYKELSDLANTPKDATYFTEQNAKLAEKQNELQQEYFSQGVYDYSKDNNGLTTFQQNQIESLHKGSLAKVQGMYAAKNETLTTKDATGAERFLANQYKAWTDSIATAIEHGFQNTVGIKFDLKQKFDQHNPTIKK